MNNELLKIENLCFSYDKNIFNLNNISFLINKKDFVSVIGRNGSGKSTLIKLLSGIYRKENGKIFLSGKDIDTFLKKELSKSISYLPQSALTDYDGLKVFDLLLLGRYAYKDFFDFRNTEEDKKIVEASVKMTGIDDFKYKYLNKLSGGEKQKVLITLALVQLNINSDLSEKVLIIDEPVTFLDVNFQLELFSILTKLNTEKNLTIIVVMHDLNLAIKYSNKTILMESGNIINYGETKEVITEETLKKYFLINSSILQFENGHQILMN